MTDFIRNQDLPVDGHVHFYPVFDLATFLESAVVHFGRIAAKMQLNRGPWHGALIFTEASGDHAFRAIARGDMTLPSGWSLDFRAEEISAVLTDDSGRRLLLVAGQQAVTREGLEVLGIGIVERCPDGKDLMETIAWIRDRQGLAVLPWGFGKWSFGRGRIIARTLACGEPARFAVGDNGGRLGIAPCPSLLRRAEKLGYAVLPGTDPLPFVDQARRVGSTGFILKDWAETSLPGQSVVAHLNRGARPRAYRQLTGPLDFFRLQIGMQLRKAART